MLKQICLLSFFAMLNATEALTRFPDGSVAYYAHYISGKTTYGIEFFTNNPDVGTIAIQGKPENQISARIENNKLVTCENIAKNEHLASQLLCIYTIVKNEFKIKQNNNTLPPIKSFK